MEKITYKKGDVVKLLTDNRSFAKHPTEERDLKVGDTIKVDSWDSNDEAIVYMIEYSSDSDGGKIWLCADDVELVNDSVSSSSECTCNTMELMRVGCKCGAITRYKDK